MSSGWFNSSFLNGVLINGSCLQNLAVLLERTDYVTKILWGRGTARSKMQLIRAKNKVSTYGSVEVACLEKKKKKKKER